MKRRYIEAGTVLDWVDEKVTDLARKTKRALPRGRQWLGHDKPGGQACQRRLRQLAKGHQL
jgi:hypothetical protein